MAVLGILETILLNNHLRLFAADVPTLALFRAFLFDKYYVIALVCTLFRRMQHTSSKDRIHVLSAFDPK